MDVIVVQVASLSTGLILFVVVDISRDDLVESLFVRGRGHSTDSTNTGNDPDETVASPRSFDRFDDDESTFSVAVEFIVFNETYCSRRRLRGTLRMGATRDQTISSSLVVGAIETIVRQCENQRSERHEQSECEKILSSRAQEATDDET